MIPYESTHPNGLQLSSLYVAPKKFLVMLQSPTGRGKTYVATTNLSLALDFVTLKAAQQ